MNADLIKNLEALTEWACTHTSPRDPNSPHELLISTRAVLEKAKAAQARAEISDNAKVTITRLCQELCKNFSPDTWGRVELEGDPKNGSWTGEILVAGYVLPPNFNAKTDAEPKRKSFLVTVLGIDEVIRRWRN